MFQFILFSCKQVNKFLHSTWLSGEDHRGSSSFDPHIYTDIVSNKVPPSTFTPSKHSRSNGIGSKSSDRERETKSRKKTWKRTANSWVSLTTSSCTDHSAMLALNGEMRERHRQMFLSWSNLSVCPMYMFMPVQWLETFSMSDFLHKVIRCFFRYKGFENQIKNYGLRNIVSC